MPRDRFAMLFVSAFVCLLIVNVNAKDTVTTYDAISPPTWTVSLSYIIDGQPVDVEPCSAFDGPTATCLSDAQPLPNLQAGEDKVVVKYSTATAPTDGSTITLRGCFSPYSSEDRPWRGKKAIIDDNFIRQCSVKVTADLAITELEDGTFGGEFSWTPGKASGPSSYTIQALEVCSDGMFCGFGQAPGFYQITPIDSIPSWLRGLVAFLICLGPVTLFAFITYESYMKKKK